MTVLILTKQRKEFDYETSKLIQSFADKDVHIRVCYFNKFDVILNHGIFYDGERLARPRAVLVRLGAGISRAELSVIRYFELEGIPCYNGSESINLVQDKFQSSEILANAGIAVPHTMIVKSTSRSDLVEKTIGFPCVVKVVVGSFGEGVYLCKTKQEYIKFIEFVDAVHNEKTLIAQEYLAHRPGEDLRVFVVGGKVLGAMKRTAPEDDFRANITNGGTGESFPVSSEIEEIALKTAEVLNLTIAGIDLLFDDRGFRVCEANSNPGFSGFDKYCNTNVADAISSFIIDKIS
jgi:gamma-F420-2:alpha-L-glutamate ligase